MEVPKAIDKSFAPTLIASLVLFGIAWRLMPHIPNFAPIGAIVLIAGQKLGWKQSLLAALAVMAISDYSIGFYQGMEWTWLGFGLVASFGYLTRKLPLSWRIPAGALGASMLFFVVSNFGTWLSSGMYSHDLTGLLQCYMMAIPFLKATILSDLLFGALILSTYELFCSLYAKQTVLEPKATPAST